MEKNAGKRIKDKMERLTQEVDEGYRAERKTPTRVHTPNPVEFDSVSSL